MFPRKKLSQITSPRGTSRWFLVLVRTYVHLHRRLALQLGPGHTYEYTTSQSFHPVYLISTSTCGLADTLNTAEETSEVQRDVASGRSSPIFGFTFCDDSMCYSCLNWQDRRFYSAAFHVPPEIDKKKAQKMYTRSAPKRGVWGRERWLPSGEGQRYLPLTISLRCISTWWGCVKVSAALHTMVSSSVLRPTCCRNSQGYLVNTALVFCRYTCTCITVLNFISCRLLNKLCRLQGRQENSLVASTRQKQSILRNKIKLL